MRLLKIVKSLKGIDPLFLMITTLKGSSTKQFYSGAGQRIFNAVGLDSRCIRKTNQQNHRRQSHGAPQK